MIEDFYKNNYYQYFNGSNDGRAIVFFHGFPGREKQNEDIAEKISKEQNINTYVFHYTGLNKSKGEFSFVKTITDSLEFILKIQKENNIISLYLWGCSWGGFVSLNLLNILQLKIPTLVTELCLLSPFSIFPDEDLMKSILVNFIEDESCLKEKKYSLDTLTRDVKVLKDSYNLYDKTWMSGAKVSIFQAKDDDEVPELTSEKLKLHLEKYISVSREIVQEGHTFDDREEVFQFTNEWLNNIKIY